MPTGKSNGSVSANTIVICLTSITVVTLGAIVAVFLASKDTTDALARAGILTAFVGIVIPQMFLLIRQDRTNDTVNAVDEKTDKILNGDFDVKIKNAVHDALDERNIARLGGGSFQRPKT